jgi:radical SAM protein with 4Fe4S-binding SPASM domain
LTEAAGTLQFLREHYLEQPNEVSLETLALCNAACTFCPYPTLERKGAKMSDELIDRLVREMATWRVPFTFAPFKVNEPLLDSRTIPLLERMNRDVPLARLRIFTNGSPLTQEKIDGIAKLKNVVHLWVSLNEHRADEYGKLMGLNFERTAKRLDNLHAQDFPHPVMLSTVGFPNEDFRRYCYGRWPKFDSMAIHRTSWLGYVTPQERAIPDRACARWFELSITATGKVVLCCMDGKEEFVLGDVTDTPMLEIYNQPRLKTRRSMLWSRKQIQPCATCNYG